MSWLVTIASQAALAAIARFISSAALEDLIVTLIAQAMRYAAKQTDTAEDDALVERWIAKAKGKNNGAN